MFHNGQIIGSHCPVAIPRSGALALSATVSAEVCSSSASLPASCVLPHLHSIRSVLRAGTRCSHSKCFEVPVPNCAKSNAPRRYSLECFGPGRKDAMLFAGLFGFSSGTMKPCLHLAGTCPVRKLQPDSCSTHFFVSLPSCFSS
ncbi:hypothetical protein TRVL_06833 [Trypanosoma vivax]|nr:hypothetical protein TRVL_06833 [Trypanosoma vivax]